MKKGKLSVVSTAPYAMKIQTNLLKYDMRSRTFIENCLLAAYRGKLHKKICSVSSNAMARLSIVLL